MKPLTAAQVRRLDGGSKEKYRRWLQYKNYSVDPALWIAEQSPFEPAPYQLEIIEAAAVTSKPVNEIIVRAPRGGGKTFITATIVSWFIDVWETLGVDWAVQTTAPTMDTLKNSLWKEIHRAVRRVKNKTAAADAATKMRMEGDYGLAISKTVSPGSAVNIEGMHAKRMLVVIDEAKGTRDEIFDSLKGSYSEAGAEGQDNTAIVLVISTPGHKMGRFYDIFNEPERFPRWNRFHIKQSQAVEAGRISRSEIEDAKLLHGVNSAVYQNHYCGEFFTDDAESFMPAHWLDQACERYHDVNTAELGYVTAGVDPASTGKDMYTVAYYSERLGGIFKITEIPYVADQVAQAKEIVGTADAFVIDTHGDRSIKNIFEALTDKPVYGFEGGHGTTWKTRSGQKVRNVRAAAFINLLQLLDPAFGATLFLPDLERVRIDIQMQKIKPTLNGVVQLYPKDWIKEKYGKSPDIADAVSMALWRPPKLGHETLPVIDMTELRRRSSW